MINIGIDASRNRSGGARAHIIGILSALDGEAPTNVAEIHVWSYDLLLDQLPNYPWLKKHTHPSLKKGLLSQILWQYFKLPKEAKLQNIDIMLNTDAGTLCRYQPSVTMSRDMLSYEPGEMQRFGLSIQRLRLILLKYVQNFSLKHSTAALFLTQYASDVIQKSSGRIDKTVVIPHGVSDNFRFENKVWKDSDKINNSIKCIYVSNVAPYKHQKNVAKAIEILRNKGFDLQIIFVGGGEGHSQDEFHNFITSSPNSKCFKQIEFLKHSELPKIINQSDLFIFASSCENMPNTLIEGMCSGLPIVCSDRGPMPEVLQDGGIYFDPENYLDIADAIEKVITNEQLRILIAEKSKNISDNYSWKRCSKETFDFLVKTIKENEK